MDGSSTTKLVLAIGVEKSLFRKPSKGYNIATHATYSPSKDEGIKIIPSLTKITYSSYS
jgi:hypothetical protein